MYVLITDNIEVYIKEQNKKYKYFKGKVYNIADELANILIESGKAKQFQIKKECLAPFKCQLIEKDKNTVSCVFIKSKMEKYCAGPYQVESDGGIVSYKMHR